MSDTTRLPDLPLHSESDLVMLALETDFQNTDLALVQLEKSHLAETFCPDVKSAQDQRRDVNTTAKLVMHSRSVMQSRRENLLLCCGSNSSALLGRAASVLSAVTSLPPALTSKIKLTNHQN